MSTQQGWTTCPMTREYSVPNDGIDFTWEELVLSGTDEDYEPLLEEYDL